MAVVAFLDVIGCNVDVLRNVYVKALARNAFGKGLCLREIAFKKQKEKYRYFIEIKGLEASSL